MFKLEMRLQFIRLEHGIHGRMLKTVLLLIGVGADFKSLCFYSSDNIVEAAGVFTGKGRMRIPFLNNIQVNMEFTNIKVNELNQVYEGEIVSIYNPNSKFYIGDVTDYWSVGDQVGNILTGEEAAQIEVDYTIGSASDVNVVIADNSVTVTNSSGETTTETITSSTGGTTISDASGNLYAVDEDGNLTKVGESGVADESGIYATNLSSYNQMDTENSIEFVNSEDDLWAFDAWQSAYEGKAIISKEYENIGTYLVPWKLIPAGKSGKIIARISKGDIDLSKVKFKTPTGTEYYAESKDTGLELTVIGSEHGDGQEIFALYDKNDSTTVSLGKVKVASYDMIVRKLHIVQVDELNVNTDEIEAGVNEIFLPYGIEWDVQLSQPFIDKTWDLNGDDKLDAGETGMLTMYTEEMKALNTAYSSSHTIDEEAIYVFVIQNSTGSTGVLLGDMPISSQFGYIFSPEGADITAKTVAHELGHGMFQLKHTFDEDYALTKSTTNNLMDYMDGTHLFKQQWDAMYDQQALLFAWAQDEEDGEALLEDDESKILMFRRLYSEVFAKNYQIKDFWSDDDKLKIIQDINAQMSTLFYIKKTESGWSWDNARFYEDQGIDQSTWNPAEASEEFKETHQEESSLAKYIINNYSEFLTSTETYQTQFDNIISYFYTIKKEELGDDAFSFEWIDGQVGDYMDPRQYYKNGDYNFTELENDVKELILLKNEKYVNSLSEELNAAKLTHYNILLSMTGEFMYRIGVQELQNITFSKEEELKTSFYSYWELTEIQQGKYSVEWHTLRDERWEREKEEWEAKLKGTEALKLYLDAVEAGKIQAIKDIVIGGTGAVLSGVIIGTSEITFGIDLALGIAGMGYALDKVTGGVNTLRVIENDVFDSKKEYRLVKGIVIDKYGEKGALIYDIGSLLVNVRSVTGVLQGSDVNAIIDYIGAGVSSYEIIEFINEKIKSNE